MDSQISEKEYKETISWLFGRLPMFSRIGAAAYKPGLDNTLRLGRLFGSPHQHFKTIHIGGTNGKGSSSHMLAAVLQAQGYKTGLYTSPHLTDFRERIRINGEMISKEAVVKFIRRWQTLQQSEAPDLNPSFFELTMMMAFEQFAQEKVDYAVIEVGMGGRLDSTNIITPLLSVITNISFDHTQFLGNTLESIAAEKAGIIKPGVPVVIGESDGAVRNVFIRKAAETGTPIKFADEDTSIRQYERIPAGWEIRLNDGLKIKVPLGGEYQRKNIRTAVCSVMELRKEGIGISNASLKTGLENVTTLTGLQGRWQIVMENPVVVCDTGHNAAGISENMASLTRRFPDRKKKFVIGFVNDKDVAHIVDLFPRDAEYYFTRASVPRAMAAEEVARHFGRSGIAGKVFPDVTAAFEAARMASGKDDVIYIGGSTFIVADFLASIGRD